jgi:HAD superfamily hydrolase (TIGR01484 family)
VHYLALCCDYDGTLAEEGAVSDATIAALKQVRASGRKLLLVTGRITQELKTVCHCLDLFDWVVAENGATLYNPATQEERLLAERPPDLFIQTLRDRGVQPLSIGRVIVAAWQPHETILLAAIRDLGLELQVIFNKDAVMVLPSGVNKASGLAAALQDLNLSPHNIVGIGDAENDHAFLGACEVGVAVDNALPLLKAAADFVTRNARGKGVVELIEELLADDLRTRESRLLRHRIVLGIEESGEEIQLGIHDFNALLMGDSGADNFVVVRALLGRLTAQGYNFCILDTQGECGAMEGAVTLGNVTQEPTLQEAQQLLSAYGANFIVNLAAMEVSKQVQFCLTLLQEIQKARLHSGRPHWLVFAEVHDLLAAAHEGALIMPLEGVLLTSTCVQAIPASVFNPITSLLAIGKDRHKALTEFSAITNVAIRSRVAAGVNDGEALFWPVSTGQMPRNIALAARLKNGPSAHGSG